MNFNQLSTITGLAVLLTAPVYATPYCIAVSGGFGNGGTTFVGRNFTMPSVSSCNPWTGYTKTASSVILITSGTACLSSDATVLTVSVSSADPSFVGAGNLVPDYIQLCPKGITHCPLGQGTDTGQFSGPADPVTCPSNVSQLPAIHD
jgi:hypothetical protein